MNVLRIHLSALNVISSHEKCSQVFLDALECSIWLVNLFLPNLQGPKWVHSCKVLSSSELSVNDKVIQAQTQFLIQLETTTILLENFLLKF